MSQMNRNKEIAPIFITGSVRSGTTIVTRALREIGIPGYDEGRFIDFLGLFLKLSDKRFKDQAKAHSILADTMLKNIPKDIFEKEFSDWFINFYLDHCRYEDVWIDKTPNLEFLYSVKLLSETLPKAKFIILKRRPIENIESRLRKFSHTDMTFEQHCLYWLEIMEKISEIQKSISSDKFIVIDQYDISQNPSKVAQDLGVFLNLNFNQVEKVKNVFLKTRPESTGGTEEEIRSLEEMPWTDEQKEHFLSTCGNVSEKFGWTLGKDYYKN